MTSPAMSVLPTLVNGNGIPNGKAPSMNLKERLKRVELLLDVAAHQLSNSNSNTTTKTKTKSQGPVSPVDVCDSTHEPLHNNSNNNNDNNNDINNGEIFTTANSAISAINEIAVDNVDTISETFGRRAPLLADDDRNCLQTEDIHTLRSLLSCPIFCRIVNVENSLENLKQQLQLHPSIVPPEFDLDESSGELILAPPVLSPPINVISKSLLYEPPSMQQPQHRQQSNQQPQQQQQQQLQQPQQPQQLQQPDSGKSVNQDLPEMESFEVTLEKDEYCLGITIAGYICQKEEIAGIFIKSISPGSPADLNGKIRVNDQIYSVDGISLVNFTNREAVELLRKTGMTVRLGLMRYLRGSKFQKLQKALRQTANSATPPGN